MPLVSRAAASRWSWPAAVLGAVLGFALGLIVLGIFMLIPRTAQAQARHNRERAERQQPEQLTENQDTVR